MKERDICCEECGKFLFKTSKSDGAAAAEAQLLGFVSKMPFLYGISGVHFFCSKECNKKWFKAHTNQEQRDSGQKKFEEVKQAIEESKPELLRGLQRIHNAFNILKKRAKK